MCFKMRIVRTLRMAVVSRRDLSFSSLSRRKPFRKQKTHVLEGAATVATTMAEESSSVQSFTQPGTTYSVRAITYSDTSGTGYGL